MAKKMKKFDVVAKKMFDTEVDYMEQYDCEGVDGYGHTYPSMWIKADKTTYTAEPHVRYLGPELETDDYNCEEDADQFAAWVKNEFCVEAKHDGSLRQGVEIASMPATLDAHMSKMGWASILTGVRRAGGSAHDAGTCGLHVHVSKNALGMTQHSIDLAIAKIMYFLESNWDDVVNFSRRNPNELAQWARKTNMEATVNDSSKKLLEKAKNANANSSRYCALNLTNTSTIEFRMFRATLNMETFAATLQFVDALCAYCMGKDLKAIQKAKMKDIVEFSPYPELRSYCVRRGIEVYPVEHTSTIDTTNGEE